MRQAGNSVILDLAIFAIRLAKQVALIGFAVDGGGAGIEIYCDCDNIDLYRSNISTIN
jgi:hypothetical protein